MSSSEAKIFQVKENIFLADSSCLENKEALKAKGIHAAVCLSSKHVPSEEMIKSCNFFFFRIRSARVFHGQYKQRKKFLFVRLSVSLLL
jgi:hypothetical protein